MDLISWTSDVGSGGINDALPLDGLKGNELEFSLNMVPDKRISDMASRYGNHRYGSKTVNAGEVWGLWEHNDLSDNYSKFRVVDGNIEEYNTSTEEWEVTESSAFTDDLYCEGAWAVVGSDPRIYVANGTDTLKWLDETGTTTDVATITGSGKKVVWNQGRLYQIKDNRLEWSQYDSDDFYKAGESYATTTNFDLFPEVCTTIVVYDDKPFVFTKNTGYWWDQRGLRKIAISERGTPSLHGAAVIPDAQILVFAGYDNIYAFSSGQRRSQTIGDKLIEGTGIGVWEVIAAANKDSIRVGGEGYKAYIAVGDFTLAGRATSGGDLSIINGCLMYESRLGSWYLLDNFHVNVFARMTVSGQQKLFYGSEDNKVVFRVGDGTDYVDHDEDGEDVAITKIIDLPFMMLDRPQYTKQYGGILIRMKPQASVSSNIAVSYAIDGGSYNLITNGDGYSGVLKKHKVSIPTDTTKEFNDVYCNIPGLTKCYALGIRLENSDAGIAFHINNIGVTGAVHKENKKILNNS